MAERSNAEVGFTAEDRKILYQVEIRMQQLDENIKDVRAEVRDGLSRIAKLEADRVSRKDIEDVLAVIETKDVENEALAKTAAATEVRLKELEKLAPQVEWIKKYLWMGLGALAVLEFLFTKLLK